MQRVQIWASYRAKQIVRQIQGLLLMRGVTKSETEIIDDIFKNIIPEQVIAAYDEPDIHDKTREYFKKRTL